MAASLTVSDLVHALNASVVAGTNSLDRPVSGGYVSDLLSCVMAGAVQGNAWVTLQAHLNVVAVASLLELACVIITEGATPDEAMIKKADEEHIPLLLIPCRSFAAVKTLVELGVESTP